MKVNLECQRMKFRVMWCWCVVGFSLNRSGPQTPDLSLTQLKNKAGAKFPTWLMATFLCASHQEDLYYFVSCNYSSIIRSKYRLTGHLVVQAAWLWSSCGRTCFALEAPWWCTFPVMTRITVRSAEQGSPCWEQQRSSIRPWSLLESLATASRGQLDWWIWFKSVILKLWGSTPPAGTCQHRGGTWPLLLFDEWLIMRLTNRLQMPAPTKIYLLFRVWWLVVWAPAFMSC